LLSLAGCGGSDDDSDTEARPQATPTSPTASPTAAPTQTEAVLTQEQLYSALVRPEDLPPSYVETEPSEDDDDDGLQGATPECTERFRVLDELGESAAELGEAEREYESEEDAAMLKHALYAYESAEQVELEFDEIAAAFRDCPAVVIEPADEPVELSITAVDVPSLGDGAAAYLASAEMEGVPVEMIVHLSYVDRYAQATSAIGLGAADGDLVLEVAALGLDRLPVP
jgi:hypothetical protein